MVGPKHSVTVLCGLRKMGVDGSGHSSEPQAHGVQTAEHSVWTTPHCWSRREGDSRDRVGERRDWADGQELEVRCGQYRGRNWPEAGGSKGDLGDL